ncbi:MAG TPA: hypothetical protein VGN14_16110 [Candidatus Elarobacter sp.]
MGRYYLIAAAIVLVVGTVIFANRMRALRDFDVSGATKFSPRPQAATNESPVPFGSFTGEGPWVLSALPSCFAQQSSLIGTTLQLTFDVPPARERIPPGTTFTQGNCTVIVRAHDVWIARGADRLRVPPEARLYRTPKGLALVYERDGRAQIRVYTAGEPGS